MSGPAGPAHPQASITARPSTSLTRRSARRARSKLWVAITNATPRSAWRRVNSSKTPSLVLGSRLPVGSSARIIAGRPTTARARATRCCSPPDSSPGRWVTRSPSPTSRRAPSATVRGTRSPSLIAKHVHGVEPRGLARRIERREKRQDEGRDGDERDLGRVHLHREVGDLVDVPRNLDDVVAVLDESDGPPQEGRSEEHTSELQSRENLVCR